jgi:hypothetical protein
MKENIPTAQNTSFDVFWALFPSPPSFWVVVRDMGVASCKIVTNYVVSKSNQMKKKKIVPTAQNTSSDVFWALFPSLPSLRVACQHGWLRWLHCRCLFCRCHCLATVDASLMEVRADREKCTRVHNCQSREIPERPVKPLNNP